jgi:very-short-patch-repair endonuclease
MSKRFKQIFTEDDYQFPKYIGSADVQSYRNDDLKSIEDGGLDSQFSRDFRNKLCDKTFNSSIADDIRPFFYIREFPIEITDRDRWLRILKSFDLINTKYVNQEFFKLDYFFKHTGLVVEIDSNFHNKKYDAARDEYLKITYGLETLRIFESPRDSDIENFIEYSLDIFNNKYAKDSIVDMSMQLTSSIFNFINIELELTYTNFYSVNKVVLCKDYFLKRYFKLSSFSSQNVFLQNFENIFMGTYNKSIEWT